MSAWRFWLLFFGEFLVVGGTARVAGASWIGAWWVALVWLIVIRVMVLAILFLLAWWLRAPRQPAARLGLAATFRLMFDEICSTFGAFFYLHPVAELFNRDPPTGAAGVPVLFVHGFLSNAGFWHPIRKHLSRAGQNNSFAVTLGPPLASLDDLAARLSEHVGRIHARAGRPLVLVAHSMGGLVARAYLERPNAHEKVRRLVTLGSPHHGTGAASFMVGTNIRQMRPGSAWLRQYRERMAAGHPVPVLSVYSYHDNIVMPQDSSVLPHARNTALPGLGHMAMAYDGRIRELLVRELAQGHDK
jgi:triacylglycerol esterase/lipase EstA (alpha/beta hydrolase family)